MFHDFVPAELLSLSMGIANLALVTLRSGFEGVLVPSKLFGYMARGIPTLYVGPPSDIAEVITRADCGACCRTGEDSAVGVLLCRAMESTEQLDHWAQNGRSFYEQHLSRELALHQYVQLARDAITAP